MGKFLITGPDGKKYRITAPDGASEQEILSYVQANATGGEQATKASPPQADAPLPELPSVYSQFSQDLENPLGMAATFGASDAQMGDIVKKQLGDRFVRMEPAGDYQIAVTRGPDGKEQRGYINRPGLDTEDITRGVRGALPYFLTGGVAGAATRGAGLLGQAAAQGVAGAATSAAGDVAQTPLGSDQGIEGGKALGAGLMGFGIPLAARAVGNAAKATREYFTPQTGPLAGKSRTAVRNIADAMEADPSITPQSVSAARAAYGPEMMVADIGATLQGDAAMLARTPVAKDVAAGRIATRTANAPARFERTLDTEMGRARNLPQYIEQGAARYNAQARPLYQQFEQTPVNPTPELANILDAAKAAGAYDRALKKLLVKRIDPNLPQNNGMFLDLIKRELDGMASTAKQQGNRTDYADYAGLAKALRDEVDKIISPNNPAASSWAQARLIAGEGLEGREAAELGSQAFGNAPKDPHLVQADLAGMSQYGQDMYREGGRNKLRQVMGRAASNFGPKGDTAARRALNSEFSRENLNQIVGPNAAQNITNRVDAENHFARLHDMALGNSVTDTMQAARQRWMPRSKTDFASEAGKKGPSGLATEYVMRLADALIGGQIRKAEARAALDGAKILTAQGRERDALVDALFRLINDRKTGAVTGQKFESMARALLEGSRAPALQNQR